MTPVKSMQVDHAFERANLERSEAKRAALQLRRQQERERVLAMMSENQKALKEQQQQSLA